MSEGTIENTAAGKGSLLSYVTGFILSLVLTAVPFALVMGGILPPATTLAAIFSAGLVQILVHLYFFLHLDASAEARWDVLALIYALLIIALFAGGGLWILYNLYGRMM